MLLFLITPLAWAAPFYQFDFNNLSIGDIQGQTDNSPNSVGVWAGQSSVPEVVSGSLSAPASTNYAFTAGGNSRRLLATRTDNAYRGNYHRVVPKAGVMWISTLVRASEDSAAAVVIDGASTNNFAGWTLNNKGGFGLMPNSATGTTEFFWSDDLTDLSSNTSITLDTNYADQTVLLLVRIDFTAHENQVDLWINPTLTTAAELGTTGDLEASTNYNSVGWLGAGAVDNGLLGYRVEFDNLLADNSPFEELAFANVTGLTAPTPPGQVALRYDFNSLAVGESLNGQVDDSSNDSGSWTGLSEIPQVASSDLFPPPSTNYGIPPIGVSGHALMTRIDNFYRGQFHQTDLATDVLWFSALIQADDSTAAAVTFQGSPDAVTLSGFAGFGIRPDAANGTALLFWDDDLSDLSGAQSTTINADLSGQTTLIVGRLDFSSPTQQVDLWLNPTLATRLDLGATGDLQATTELDEFNWIGFGTIDDSSRGYLARFDNLLFNNHPNEDLAFTAVTEPLIPPPSSDSAAADLNNNGIADYAELIYPELADLPPTIDSDKDGQSNAQESFAGTDPFDPSSYLRALSFNSDLDFTFTSVAGKQYQIEQSQSLLPDSWTPLGNLVTATGPVTTVTIPFTDLESPDTAFIQARVASSLDSDDDGLEDTLESYLGFSSTSSSSVRSSAKGGDYQHFANLMTGGNPTGGLAGTNLLGTPSEEHASRFLAQATWGPKTSDIINLRSLGPNAYEQWIDLQLTTSPTFTGPYISYLEQRISSDNALGSAGWNNLPHFFTNQSTFAHFRENLNTVWMRNALFGEDQLRQRTTWAFSQILVIGPRCNSFAKAASSWYDTLHTHAFGNYRDMLYNVSIHPWMGWWLSHVGNEKATQVGTAADGSPVLQMPDENFAREIMQLFSIGLWELNMDGTRKLDLEGNPIPTYTNEDITQVARVFTGLTYQSGATGRDIYSTVPMQVVESRHDIGELAQVAIYGAAEKTFLGHSLPPGQTTLDDINDTIDILINHPNTPPFISKNLIQHLVTSNPSPAYVERVSQIFADDGSGTRGNLAAVIKAILLDPEARNLSYALNPNSGRLKGPMLRTVALARYTQAGSDTPSLYDDTGIQFWNPRKATMFAEFLEYPFEAPSVFNFYEPGYSLPGEIRESNLLSPEFQIMNALTSTTIPNRLLDFIENGFHDDSVKNPGVTPSFTAKLAPLETLSQTGAEALVDEMNLIFAHGFVSPASRTELINRVNFLSNSPSNASERAKLALFLSAISPEGAVLK
ncbi:MAG: DUF1800 domain-containing protein [Akkermansiaceae bacterium]